MEEEHIKERTIDQSLFSGPAPAGLIFLFCGKTIDHKKRINGRCCIQHE